jgi:hypothetical protein
LKLERKTQIRDPREERLVTGEHSNADVPLAEVATPCPECGFLFAGKQCPLCGRMKSEGYPESNRQPIVPQRQGPTFGLSGLFLFITLVSVCLGVGMAAPGLAVLLAVIAVPALVRASASAKREQAAGRQPDIFDRIGLFASSMGIIALIALAGCVAFFAACLGSCALIEVTGAFRSRTALFNIGDSGLFLINIVSGSLALALVGWLFWKTWPRRRGRPK